MMLLDHLPKSPAVEAALSALSLELRIALNILFLHTFIDPFSRMLEYSLENVMIDGEKYEILRGRFEGAFISLFFQPNDDMHIIDLLPLKDELASFLDVSRQLAN